MIPSRQVGDRPETAAPDTASALELIAAIIATDSRSTAVFSLDGKLLLANAVAGAANVALWHDFGRSADWAGACEAAQASGGGDIRLATGDIYQLHPVPDMSGRPRYWLMRLSHEAGNAQERSLAERITDMAHDLRAPLQSLMIAADGFRDEDGHDAELVSLAQLALDQIGNLLETTRMEQVSAESEPRAMFDLRELVRDMIRLLDPICRRSGNFIVAKLDPDEAWFSGTPQLIRTILQNLITNANRFNTNGPITVRLRFAATEGDFERLVTLEIEDVGPGLSEAERGLLLTPGPRRGAGTSPGDGYGLGLGIVSRAIKRLRGQIEALPGAECGTVFRITFPLHVGREPSQDAVVADSYISLAGLKILVVEDNPINLAILLRTLTDAGAEAEGVINGADAMQCVSEQPGRFDVILLDITLPDINGIEIARRIRDAEPAGQHVLIVGLTAHVGSVVHGSGLAAGMDHLLIKPVRPSELRLALRDAKEGARPRQQMRNRMQRPDVIVNETLIRELTEEMGRTALLTFMQRALEEGRSVLDAAKTSNDVSELRGAIHSAIGSAGLTGLSGVEYALRCLQAPARDGMLDESAMEIAAEMVDETEKWLGAARAEG